VTVGRVEDGVVDKEIVSNLGKLEGTELNVICVTLEWKNVCRVT
jgi:hypothetical protein